MGERHLGNETPMMECPPGPGQAPWGLSLPICTKAIRVSALCTDREAVMRSSKESTYVNLKV